MSSKLLALIGSVFTPTITIAYIDTYWHKGYTDKYLSIGQKIIQHPPIKEVLDELHNVQKKSH